MHSSQAKRFHYLDHMRGLVIALVVLQHAVQAYGRQWGGRWWFVPVDDRDNVFDVMFMWTDSFIIQALFFISGIFVLSSLKRRGFLSFTLEKFIRLGIPLIFGVLFLVPPLRYVKFHLNPLNSDIGFLDYWWNTYLLLENISASGFWFLAFLLMFSFVMVFVDKLLPFITNLLGRLVQWLCHKPVLGYLIVATITAILIGYSDIRWGTQPWIGLHHFFDFPKDSKAGAFLGLFVARGNMLFSFIFFFLLGVGVWKSGVLKESDVIDRASKNWGVWLIALIVLSIAYSWYNQVFYYDGAFNNELWSYFHDGGTWSNAWPLIKEVAPGLLIRTTLHGFLCTTQVLALMIILYRFANVDKGAWTSLAACSYGIYVFHEPLVVWTQYWLMDSVLPNTFKMLLAFAAGLGGAWLIAAYVLRKLPILRRIF